MAAPISLTVNGRAQEVPAEPDTPLLYVLRNDLGLNGAKYGCGSGQCGSCTVLVDGHPTRSCITEIGTLAGRRIVTLEGLPTNGEPWQQRGLPAPHKLQRAFIAEQAAQCGYCIPGMIMSAFALLQSNPEPTEPQIVEALAGNLCRCGTHPRIVRAIQRAVREG